MKCIDQCPEAQQCVALGHIIAYPTEAVYGLGCDPFNEQVVQRLLSLKGRVADKGLILLIAHWHQLFPLIDDSVTDALLAPVQKTWPGHVTWLFPKAKDFPVWVSGDHDTVAIRMTNHPIARQLCDQSPLISTSANISGEAPATDYASVVEQFPDGIDVFFDGALGEEKQPSSIYDVVSGARLR